MARIFIDTNVLFPFSVMDLMPALTENAVHEIVWTERLLGEWERVIVREQQRSPDAAAAIAETVREFFGDSRVDEASYAALLPEITGPDPDDCHHMAAAIASGATCLVTWNRSDFPDGQLSQHGVMVVDPDSYLCGLLDESPEEVEATIVRMAAGKRRPPLNRPGGILEALANAGVPKFAERLRPRLGRIADQAT